MDMFIAKLDVLIIENRCLIYELERKSTCWNFNSIFGNTFNSMQSAHIAIHPFMRLCKYKIILYSSYKKKKIIV